ncbi:MAG: type III restriction endonuclease subunit R, partial [Patescibacteria group bacterium]
PVLPDSASRAKLQEHTSAKYTEKYKDYIHLGFLEWRKVYDVHTKLGKKAVLFVMTDDTKNCDEVAEYLENTYAELKDAVLVIHTKDNGEISESVTGKKEEELKILRKAANEIDRLDSPYKAIVSVLMLKEGWDVRNVTTIVGLRAYVAQSNILPEQTLGRGLRRMYRDPSLPELVSVVGTDAFMDFVESIKSEGVELEHRKMGEGTDPKSPLVVEIDREKDIEKMDIQIPVLTPRIYREYKNLSGLDVSKFGHKNITLKEFSEAEKREIVFRDIASGDITHKTELDSNFVPNYQSVIGYFTQVIMKELRLVSGYDILYGKVKEFIQGYLFNTRIDLDNLNSLRNLSEIEASRTIFETFKKEINTLTVLDKGEAEIRDYIKISKSRPFVVKDQGYIVPKKSIFNKIIGDSHFELEFAGFLEKYEDIISYAKNYFAVHFKIDYKNADGSISDYYPDFIVKVSPKEYYVVETKGREDLDDVEKIKRLAQWCVDVNANQKNVVYKMLYIKQESWEAQQQKPRNFQEVIRTWIKK